MKQLIYILLAVFLAMPATESISMATESYVSQKTSKKPKKDIRTVTLSANIHCKNCANKIRENIAFEKGVEDLEVSVEQRTVVIKYNAAKTSVETLLSAMKKLGYPAKVVE